MNEEPKNSDVLGLKPYGEAINTLSQGIVDGAGAFLSRICLPAAEEYGLLLQYKVRCWRVKNLVKMSQQTEKIRNRSRGI